MDAETLSCVEEQRARFRAAGIVRPEDARLVLDMRYAREAMALPEPPEEMLSAGFYGALLREPRNG